MSGNQSQEIHNGGKQPNDIPFPLIPYDTLTHVLLKGRESDTSRESRLACDNEYADDIGSTLLNGATRAPGASFLDLLF